MLEEIFQSLGLKSEDTKAYLYLLERGGQSAGRLAKFMDMPRTTLYGYLERLQNEGLVSQNIHSGIKIFSAEPLEKVEILYKRRIDKMKQKQKELEALMPLMSSQIGSMLYKPRIHFYEGQEGLQTVLEDMLLKRDIQTQALWPIENMMDVMSEDFTHFHNVERIKRNISIQVIWPETQVNAMDGWPYLSVGQDFLREARVASTDIDFKMGYWIYDDKAAFISSRAETVGFTVESAEFIELLKMQFGIIWNIAKPFEFRARGADIFLGDTKP